MPPEPPLTLEQLEKLREQLWRLHGYLVQLDERLEANGHQEFHPLRRIVVQARSRLQELKMHVHYMACEAQRKIDGWGGFGGPSK